jgi:hypothetical protein
MSISHALGFLAESLLPPLHSRVSFIFYFPPPLRVSNAHCFIVRVPRAVEILILFAPLPPVRRMLQNKRVTGLSFTAHIERPFSISII